MKLTSGQKIAEGHSGAIKVPRALQDCNLLIVQTIKQVGGQSH